MSRLRFIKSEPTYSSLQMLQLTITLSRKDKVAVHCSLSMPGLIPHT